MPPIVLVATLEVRASACEAFHAFERQAAAIIQSHGGRIERTVTIEPEAGDGTFREIHIVTFPSEEARAAYAADPRLSALAALRASAVVSTTVLAGTDGPDYHAQRGSSA